jgi:hypothetical protein
LINLALDATEVVQEAADKHSSFLQLLLLVRSFRHSFSPLSTTTLPRQRVSSHIIGEVGAVWVT